MLKRTDYTNPERIISLSEALTISKKEYSLLKQISHIERENIIKYSNQEINNELLLQKIYESISNNPTYKSLPNIKKEIIISNTLLPDNIQIIDILSSYGFTIDHLKTIIRFRGILKNLLLNKNRLDKELKDKIETYKKVITKLIDIFSYHFNFNNSTIILNRISELLVTCPNLFETKKHSNKLIK